MHTASSASERGKLYLQWLPTCVRSGCWRPALLPEDPTGRSFETEQSDEQNQKAPMFAHDCRNDVCSGYSVAAVAAWECGRSAAREEASEHVEGVRV